MINFDDLDVNLSDVKMKEELKQEEIQKNAHIVNGGDGRSFEGLRVTDKKRYVERFADAVHTYLSALPSSPVSELVDLRECLDRFVVAFPAAADYPLIKRGYAALTTLSTHNAELEREVERLREALEMISHMHDSNPPLPLADMPELDYARRTISTMRREALAALSTSPQGGDYA